MTSKVMKWYQSPNNETMRDNVIETNGVMDNYKRISLYSLADVQLRFLCPDDLDEVRTLCQDWFPIEYPFYWYEEITSSCSRFYSLAAVYQKQIIGLIVGEIRPHSSLNEEDTGILAKRFSDCDIAYILSLGVLKEYRRNGIATLLLDSLLKNLTAPERHRVKAVFLHVLSSNTAAIKFYERRDFSFHSFLPYYYSIKGKCKDGLMYVSYINDGHRPWTIYDYIKFMCGKMIKGAGIFPLVFLGVNKALGWVWKRRQNIDNDDITH